MVTRTEVEFHETTLELEATIAGWTSVNFPWRNSEEQCKRKNSAGKDSRPGATHVLYIAPISLWNKQNIRGRNDWVNGRTWKVMESIICSRLDLSVAQGENWDILFLYYFSHTWLKMEPSRGEIKTHYYMLWIFLQLVWKDIKNHI